MAGGKGSVLLADGSEVEVTAERIVYSADTADMFEQAEGYVYPENGNLALKPIHKKGWKTYNFEVEEFHTYVAGGVRVHNDSWDILGVGAGSISTGVGTTTTGAQNAWQAINFNNQPNYTGVTRFEDHRVVFGYPREKW
ncbi:hypothetical protein GFK91_29635 (plasmid) [Roseibium aggregatum]|uniref:hypothetical protein n=1 Tax=Roseibium aggregatum TaxID=187304 RepID=UPI001E62D4F7|nr:hypothetical protein [Roseibium aggregatum]UES59914.1 hypothetical protein GFK91_29635 [Roseibium aggregatum]